MGLGDQILAAGQAKLLNKQRIGDGSRVLWNPLYDFIPYLDKKKGDWLIDFPGRRGYIRKTERNGSFKRIHFNMDYRAEPAVINLDPIDNDYVIIESRIKSNAPPAKLWKHYQQVVDAVDCKFLQFNKCELRGVDAIDTDIIKAARYIAGCRCYIGTEGFLHHLAAAFHKPAVVVIGAYSPPEVIGYDFHTNISVHDPEELGHTTRTGAMDKITPDEVIQALRDLL